MTINDKLNQVLPNMKYNFCGIDFDIYKTDYIRVYSKLGGTCVYSITIDKYNQLNEKPEIFYKEHIKEELIKLKGKDYALCFYLGTPKEIVEDPISAKMIYIN